MLKRLAAEIAVRKKTPPHANRSWGATHIALVLRNLSGNIFPSNRNATCILPSLSHSIPSKRILSHSPDLGTWSQIDFYHPLDIPLCFLSKLE